MSEAEKKKEYDLFTDYNPENYELSWDNYKVTGFRTLAEYSAYTKAREDEQNVCFQFLKNWNYGETNSAFGAEIQKKVEAYKAALESEPSQDELWAELDNTCTDANCNLIIEEAKKRYRITRI